MFKWFKKLKRIIDGYDSDRDRLLERITIAEKIIKDRTDIHVDYHMKGQSFIFVSGRYRGMDYMQSFNVGDKDFRELVEILKQMSRHASVRRIDCPPSMKQVFEHELSK